MTTIENRSRPNLNNISLSRKEDWLALVQAPPRTRPEVLTRKQMVALSPAAKEDYNRRRHDWHANATLKTPQLQALHEHLWDIIDSNVHDGNRVKGAVALDAPAGMGKSTAMELFGIDFHRRELAAHGPRTSAGHQRLPVSRLSLMGSTTIRELSRMHLQFFGHPGSERGTAAQYVRRALDCVLSCETRLLIIDDLHFLRWHTTNGVEVSNHFKHLASEFPVTLIFIGVGLAESGLFTDGTDSGNPALAQTGRRTTLLGMKPFGTDTAPHRQEWTALLKGIERRLVLADNREGMLADELNDYLYARSTGHIGSLMTLINRGCVRAVRTKAERLSEELLDQVPIDAAAEQIRPDQQAKQRNRRRRRR
jgi:hypothetical protein